MSLKKVSAIFDSLKLEDVEHALLSHGVRGFTVHNVKGRGAYFNSYSRDPLTQHILLEVYTSARCAEAVAQLIVQAAHANADNEGLVSIESVDDMFWIHTKQCCDENEFKFMEESHV